MSFPINFQNQCHRRPQYLYHADKKLASIFFLKVLVKTIDIAYTDPAFFPILIP